MPFRRPRRRCCGFTALELVVVIAVTGIVGVMGYSAWRTLVVRSQVSEAVAAMAPLQHAVLRAFRNQGEVPASMAERLSAQNQRFIASATVDNGRIDLVFGGAADGAIFGRRLSLTPYETATSDVLWLCGNEIPSPGEQPLGFAGGGLQAEQIPTTIEARYLPAGCR